MVFRVEEGWEDRGRGSGRTKRLSRLARIATACRGRSPLPLEVERRLVWEWPAVERAFDRLHRAAAVAGGDDHLHPPGNIPSRAVGGRADEAAVECGAVGLENAFGTGACGVEHPGPHAPGRLVGMDQFDDVDLTGRCPVARGRAMADPPQDQVAAGDALVAGVDLGLSRSFWYWS